MLEKSIKVLKHTNAKMVIPLMVSGAFHSDLMKEGEEEFGGYMKNYVFSPPQLKVMSNYTGELYTEDVFQSLKKQISNPVRWFDIISKLIHQNATFFEIGTGDTLTKIVSNIKKNR
jgi:malonyl CoA-acyl carrier protein transacylase